MSSSLTTPPTTSPTTSMTVYGDFNCPWSYLTWRRSELLRGDGVEIDWRAVEHDPWQHQTPERAADRQHTTRAALHQVEERLLPGERLPHAFTGVVPFTGAATAAYAEAVVAGVAADARRVLFEAFWLHGADLDNARVVRDLLASILRGRQSRSELVHLWGYSVDVTGGPITTDAWRLVRDWRKEWQGLGEEVVPALSFGPDSWLHGKDVLERLGREVHSRGLDVPDSTREPA